MGVGAAINQTARFANITLAESDDPRGLVYFTIGSRLPVATLKNRKLSLQVYRQASASSAMSVRYRMLVSWINKNTRVKYTYIHADTHNDECPGHLVNI